MNLHNDMEVQKIGDTDDVERQAWREETHGGIRWAT